jgi:predicted transposase/invertase (TIGR01784 family)
MRQDAIFYQLFKRFPTLFFELIALPAEQAQGYRFESIEVKEPSFRIDGVFLPTEAAASQTVFFVEVQFQKDQSLYHRFFSEILLYLRRNPNQYEDWQGILIFPARGLEPDHDGLHRSLLSSEQVQFIYLDELPIVEDLAVSLMRLTIAPEDQMAEQARRLIERAKQEDSPILSASEIIEVVATIATYKFVNMSRAEVEAMLGLKLGETRIYQEAREEERREDIQSLLEAKFGELDEGLRSIVEPLMQLAAIDRARLILQMSKEEIIAQFRASDT